MRFSIRRSLPNTVSIQAFTLIELLVVISIIAVLAGLLLPVGNKVIENGKKVSAKSTMMQIVGAVKNYQSEYGTYPVVAATAAGGGAATTATDSTFDDTDTASDGGEAGHNHLLFNVLRALNSTDTDPNIKALNARRISYFEYKDVKNRAAPKDGFIPAPPAGAAATPIKGARGVTLAQGDLVDPWGNLFFVRIDTGYTDRVIDPFQDASTLNDDANTADNKLVHTSAIAWTIGAGTAQYSASGGATAGTFETSGNVATWR